MINTKRCCFERDEYKCTILIEKHCDGCKFKKNYIEFVKAQKATEQRLKDRGLKAVKVETEKGSIITVIERG